MKHYISDNYVKYHKSKAMKGIHDTVIENSFYDRDLVTSSSTCDGAQKTNCVRTIMKRFTQLKINEALDNYIPIYLN